MADRYLLATNAYPNDRELYRYAFVHSRVKAYLAAGLDVDVYCVDRRLDVQQEYLFDEVRVLTGSIETYRKFLLSRREYTKYLVHFPVEYLLEPLLDSPAPSILWMHGYEVEAWHRRWFNLIQDPTVHSAELSSIARRSDMQRAKLKEFLVARSDAQCVTVSQWFLNHVLGPDLNLPLSRALVIPNYIDGDLFAYVAKDASLARRVLVVRPFTNWKYATDDVVDAILEVSRRRPGGDVISFTVFGDGALFDSVTKPLRALPDVTLQKTFLTPAQVAEQHARHGLFLAPTRWDSQGVSTCEAMASGLVPITSATSAIPEYVQHDFSGLLAPYADATALADNIITISDDPEHFTRMSAQAARSIREKCGYGATIGREIDLICGRASAPGGAVEVDWKGNYRQLEQEMIHLIRASKQLLEGRRRNEGGPGGDGT